MYQCPVTFYLVGLTDEIERIIRDAKPLPSFTHSFTSSDEPNTELAAGAGTIFADVTGKDAVAWAETLLARRKPTCTVTLIASHEQIDQLAPFFGQIADIWTSPVSAVEAAYRFDHWQRGCKRYADAWETSQFLEATINSIPSLVWYKSDDGIHHKVNDAFCATVNKAKEQVQGRGHAYIWDVEADDPACIESERQVMETKSTIVSEETVQTSDGTRLLTTYKSPLYNIDGSVMGTVGVGIDVTKERAFENEIVEKNRTMETIFTTMECGVITHSLDGTRLIGANQAALNILGYESSDELMAAGFDMVAPSVIPEDAARLRDSISMLKHVGDSVSTEYRVRHNNGDILHVLGSVKLIENDGELFYQRFLLDYTDKKLEEVQRDRRQNDLIQALSEDYLVVCSFSLDSEKGMALRVSDGEHRGLDELFAGALSLDSCIDGYIEANVVEEDQPMLREALSAKGLLEALADQARTHVNYRIHRDDATEYCQATVVRSGDWQFSHDVVLGLRSVDAQTREEMKKKALLEEALTEANRANAAKSAFLSNMSHDIRTPMNAIVGFTTLAASRIDQQEKVREYLDKIQSSSTHLLNLINDILDMSHIESGKVSLDEQPYNLVDLLDDLYSIIQAETSARQLYFSVNTDGIRHTDVRCDKLRLNQILLNLLGNALKFTKPGGFIKVKVEELDGAPAGYGRFRFKVSDTGIGMSPEFVEHIFDPFERERTSTISGIQGTGLGMAITKNLVDMMHGSIAVESERDAGTTFTIELDLQLASKSDAAQAKAAKTPHLDPSHSMRGSRILLVDDNDLNREIAITLLEDEGFTVEYAVNGCEAVEKLMDAPSGHFQLVLMDVQMPVMNGYEATKAIRRLNDPARARIPILAMTADAFEEDRQKALRSGMNGHLTKPIEIDKLFAALDAVLS
ncbi:ATP-binding protein [Adlercreutzia sp. R25]|uniref:histidine kinase n=1 Tax=Adlercreutzia shanghongiae TaxID=3111773 RepID=A0ABU6J0G4_9ACTN|nr:MULTISPECIES: ATP-binding protein [unclassified Adlercreutzia]MEC4273115.1 ATP-binding protein [Adlercreutzia sp. R25]MEC4295400.1 ATP-binding protein [Adlercreutzia sp. R22]